MRLEINGKKFELDFEDRFDLIGADRLLSRATVSKWGFRLGAVTLVMERAKPVRLQAVA